MTDAEEARITTFDEAFELMTEVPAAITALSRASRALAYLAVKEDDKCFAYASLSAGALATGANAVWQLFRQRVDELAERELQQQRAAQAERPP